jgi:hypothetical protein
MNFPLSQKPFDVADLAVDLSFEGVTPPPGPRRPAGDELAIGRLRHVTSTRQKHRDLLGAQQALEHIVKLPGPCESLHLILPGTYSATRGHLKRLAKKFDCSNVRQLIAVSAFTLMGGTSGENDTGENTTATGSRKKARLCHV